jgi:hypothetical protein
VPNEALGALREALCVPKEALGALKEPSGASIEPLASGR